MFAPNLNDAHVVVGSVGKRQEDRNNDKYGLSRFAERDYDNS